MGKHFRLGLASQDVVAKKSAVKTDRFRVKLGQGVHASLKPTTPCLLAHATHRPTNSFKFAMGIAFLWKSLDFPMEPRPWDEDREW